MEQESHQKSESCQPSSPSVPLALVQLLERYWNIIRQKIARYCQPSRIDHYRRILEKSMIDPVLDRALGSIYGAMIGDALGAYCEFNMALDDQTVREAMEMNGGGTFGLEAGQFTDDSELAAHLLHGLSFFDQNKPLAEQVTQLICRFGLQYIKWMDEGPFDIGNTCRGGIYTIENYKTEISEFTKETNEKPEFLDQMFAAIYNRNKSSLANGSLMRISPQAFFFSLTGESPLQHAQFIQNEIRLTHPNEILRDAGLFWVQLLTDLIHRPDNSAETFSKIYTNRKSNPAFSRLKTWFEECERKKQQAMLGNQNMGYVKIAFSYGLRIVHYLAQGWEKRTNEDLYLDWMSWIIKRAGDTDTNGAIAGGLMGSIIGFWGLPSKYIVRTLKTITDGKQMEIQDEQQQPKIKKRSKYCGPKRPNFYEPCRVLLEALDMVERCEHYKQKFHPNK